MATNHLSMRSGARLFITLLATLSILTGQLAGLAVPPAAASPLLEYEPTGNNGDAYDGPATQYVVDGNWSCEALGDANNIDTEGEIKFDFKPDVGHSITQDGITVTITDRYEVRNEISGLFFDYAVTGGVIRSAFLKQGPGGMFYLYDAPGVTGDAGLHPQEKDGAIWADVSHISFCYDPEADPTGSIELDKHDLDGNSLSGATLQLFEGSGTDGPQVGSDCLTDGTNPCVFGDLDLGTYTAVEEAAPDGYRDTDTSPKELTLDGDTPDLTRTFAFKNTPIPYRITVEQDDVNPVGDPHTFTVTVEHAPDSDDVWEKLADADVDLAWVPDSEDGTGTITDIDAGTIDGDGLGGTCTTDAVGTCEVTVDSSQIGKGELFASFDTPYQYTTSTQTVSSTFDADGTVAEVSDSATKEWRGLHVDITEDGVNLAGSEHPFTVTVTDSDGAPLSGADVTISWDGPEGSSIEIDGEDPEVVGNDGTPVSVTCETDADSECGLIVRSDDVAQGTATITEVTAQIQGAGGTMRDLTVSSDGEITFADGDTTSATKTWIDFEVEISDDAVNYVEWNHSFEITVKRITPDAPQGEAVPGATVEANWETDGLNRITADDRTDAEGLEGACVTDGDGICTITIEALDDEPSSGTLTVTGVGNVGVAEDGVVSDSGTGGVTVDVTPASAVKEWVDYAVTVTPDGVNPVGTDDEDDSLHTFTITADRTNSDLDDDLSTITVDLVWQGDVGSIIKIGETTQSDGTVSGSCQLDAGGACEVVVDSDEAGQGSLVVTGLTDAAVTSTAHPDGVVITFITENELDGFDCEGDDNLCATKTWVAFGISVTPDDEVNHVEVSHTFTVELTGDLDAVEVDSFTYRFDGSLADGEGGLGDDATRVSTTCGVDADNPCEIVVSADVPGDLRLTVTSATITIGEDTFSIPFGDGAELDATPAVNQADKGFVDYRVELERPAFNLLGDAHSFEVTVERLTVEGAELAEGVELTLCWDGPVGSALLDADADGCQSVTTGTGDDAGTVTVTVSTPTTAGTGSLTVASIDADGDVVLPEDGVITFTYVDGIDEADKTWIVYDLELSSDAINALGDAHDFVVSDVTVDDGSGPVTASGATITAIWSEDEVGETRTCVVDATGTCTITITSLTEAGSGTLTLTLLEHTFEGESFTVDLTDTLTAALADGAAGQDATKTWRDFRVTITPDDINLTGDSHTFDVTVEQTDDGEVWDPVPDGTTLTSAEVTGFDLQTVGLDTEDLTLSGSCLHSSTLVPTNGGTVDGDCTLTVTSLVPGQVEITVHTILVANDQSADDIDGLGEVTFVLADDDQDSAFKTWIEIDASLTPPSATNLVEEQHDFEVEVTVIDGGAGVALDGMELCFSWDGDGTPHLTDDCVQLDSEDLAGLTGGYTYTVDAPEDLAGATAGMGTLDLDSVTVDVSQQGVERSFTVPNEDGFGLGQDLSQGEPSDLGFPLTATKLWIDYGLSVGSAVNPLPGGEEHTFEVTLRSSDPGTLADGYTPGEAAVVGDGVTISLIYTGTGEVTHVNGVEVADGFDPSGFDCSPTPVLDGQDVIGRCTVTVTTDWTDHPSEGVGIGTLSAYFQGTAADSQDTLDLVATGTKTWIAIAIEKEAVTTADEIAVGELVEIGDVKAILIALEEQDTYTVDYAFTVTNPTDRPLLVTSITDVFVDRAETPATVAEQDLLDTFIDANGSAVLAPDAQVTFTVTYVLTADDVDRAFLDNTVTVTGVDEASGEGVSDTADETVGLILVDPAVFEPAITVTKTAVDGVTEDDDGNFIVTIEGEDGSATATYEFVVTNTGDDDLSDLTLVDDKIGDLTDALTAALEDAFGSATLPVGESVTVTADHEVTAADFDGITLTNVVDVEGVGVDSGATVDDSDDETVTLVEVLAEVLPRTGVNAAGLTSLGVLLAMIGAASLLFTRRRREEDAS